VRCQGVILLNVSDRQDTRRLVFAVLPCNGNGLRAARGILRSDSVYTQHTRWLASLVHTECVDPPSPSPFCLAASADAPQLCCCVSTVSTVTRHLAACTMQTLAEGHSMLAEGAMRLHDNCTSSRAALLWRLPTS
jgi:hypothetical protein